MQDAKQKIIEDLRKIVNDLTGQDITPNLEHPKDEGHGDYSSNIAMAIFSSSKFKVQSFDKLRIDPERSRTGQSSKFRTPMDLAMEIANKLEVRSKTLEVIEKIEAVKPGFINFYLSEKYLLDNIKIVLEQKEKFGSKTEDPNKKALPVGRQVVVEYSSPNIAKPFTVGHLRSTIIGDAIANLLEANGWKVYRDNHLGDWGTQFGKQIYAIKTWGDEEKIETSQNPVKELVALYVKFHEEAEKNPELEVKAREWFKKLEEGDKEARRLWKKCIEWTLKEFQKIYDQLGIKFTENNGSGFGESFFEDKMGVVIKELDEKKLLKESEGAKLVFFPEDLSTRFAEAPARRASSGQVKSFGSAQDKYPPLMIVKKDGATLYATRDLATDKFRLNKYGKDVVVINEVGIEQSLYFKQIFEIEKMLGWVKTGQRIHKKHGHYRFKDEKMSTRKGNVIWLDEVLEEVINKAHDIAMRVGVSEYEGGSRIKSEHIVGGKSKRDEITRQVAIGAIKWNDLKRSSNLDIVFDWDEILNMEGNSGPYLQYAFARTQSVVRKSEIRPSTFAQDALSLSNGRNPKSETGLSFAGSHLEGSHLEGSHLARLEVEEESILRAIHRFPEVVGEAAENFAPNILCNYLFDLAQKFNLFYQKHKILESENREFRLVLTVAVGQVIKNGLYMLGIQAPERM